LLDAPGEADLSAHVDFAALARAARERGADVAGPVTQRTFLEAIGIRLRAERLRRDQSETAATAISEAVERLCGPDQMGALFKAMAVIPAGLNPAGFDAGQQQVSG
jgi:NADH dehydrogenase [ubiquinone] 1 alpha subcomplex assembly factor 7